MSDLEHRALLDRPEFRSQGGKLVAAGVAMRYGARSKPIAGQFREVFLPGAFTESVRQHEVYSHNEHHGPYLARTGAGTLRLTDSRSELAYELDIPDTSAGRDTAALLERGDIKGSSIGFKAAPKGDSWTVDTDGFTLRTVKTAVLARVDLTIAPCYDESTAEMAYRSLAEQTGMAMRSLLDATGRGELARLLRPAGRRPLDGRPSTGPRPAGRRDATGAWVSPARPAGQQPTVIRHPTYY